MVTVSTAIRMPLPPAPSDAAVGTPRDAGKRNPPPTVPPCSLSISLVGTAAPPVPPAVSPGGAPLPPLPPNPARHPPPRRTRPEPLQRPRVGADRAVFCRCTTKRQCWPASRLEGSGPEIIPPTNLSSALTNASKPARHVPYRVAYAGVSASGKVIGNRLPWSGRQIKASISPCWEARSGAGSIIGLYLRACCRASRPGVRAAGNSQLSSACHLRAAGCRCRCR